MHSPQKWHDEYIMTKNRIHLTEQQLHIPGLRMFGHHLSHNATESLTWHYHEDSFEFSIPSKGTFSFSTEKCTYPFSGGDVFISYPNEVHGTDQTPITVGELYWFQLDISDENSFLFLKPEAARAMISDLKSLSRHVVKTDSKKTLPIIEKAFEAAKTGEDCLLVASFLQFFLHLVIIYSKKEPFQISPDIQKSLDYIREHITMDLSLNDLALLSNLSCSQFKQKFKKQLGISPRHFINQQKIEYSKPLLLEGKSVTEISMLLNFTTSSYFSTVFKKYTSYSPREYIKVKKCT